MANNKTFSYGDDLKNNPDSGIFNGIFTTTGCGNCKNFPGSADFAKARCLLSASNLIINLFLMQSSNVTKYTLIPDKLEDKFNTIRP